MKKILGIVGSPRRNGNTHLLVLEALQGAQERGAEVECVLLGDLNIRECDGCHACWQGRHCPKQDDMSDLYPKIVASDALIFGTPVYWYGPTALMKALIDRFVYFNCPQNRPGIAGKSAAAIVPCEEGDPAAAALVVEFFRRCFAYLELNRAGELIVPGVTRKGEVAARADRMTEARELGGRMAQ